MSLLIDQEGRVVAGDAKIIIPLKEYNELKACRHKVLTDLELIVKTQHRVLLDTEKWVGREQMFSTTSYQDLIRLLSLKLCNRDTSYFKGFDKDGELTLKDYYKQQLSGEKTV